MDEVEDYEAKDKCLMPVEVDTKGGATLILATPVAAFRGYKTFGKVDT